MMNFFRKRLAVVYPIMAVILLSACSSVADSSNDIDPAQTNVVNVVDVVSGQAVLDWGKAQIRLPLDEYGMTDDEKGIVYAARAVIYWQCASQSVNLSSQAMQNIREWRDWSGDAASWDFGFWDTAYIASYGYTTSPSPLLGSEEIDQMTRIKCMENEQYQNTYIVDRSTVSRKENTASYDLIRYSIQAWDKTLEDSRYQSLIDERAVCLHEAGYATEDDPSVSSSRSVHLDPSWGPETQQKAFLAEASCSDHMGFTQRAADLNAAYEQQVLDEHQAELVEIKKVSDEQVAKATKILQDAGVM